MSDTDVKVMTKEDIDKRMATDDAFVYEYLNGKVKIGTPEAAPTVPASAPVAVVQDGTTPTQSSTPAPQDDPKVDVSAMRLDLEARNKMLETMRQQQREEREQMLLKQKELADQIEAMKRERAPVEPKQQHTPYVVKDDVVYTKDDEEFATSIDFKNKKRIDAIQEQLKALGNNHPEITELRQELKAIKDERETAKRQEEENKKLDAQRKENETILNNVRELQNKYKDKLSTKNPIEKINSDYSEFERNIAWLIKTEDPATVNLAVHDYMYGQSDAAKKLREQAKSAGVTPPEDCETYMKIAKVVDMYKGYEFDAATGKYKAIVDSLGNKVRYRSLDEAFKLSNFDEIVSEAHKKAALEFQNANANRSNSARTLSNDQTAPITDSNKLTNKRIGELLDMEPWQYRNDPALAAQVAAAYAMCKIQMPVSPR